MKKILPFLLSVPCVVTLYAEVSLKPVGRTVFYRGEPGAAVTAEISGDAAGKQLEVSLPGTGNFTVDISGSKVKIPVDTRLRPGKYPLRWKLSGDSGSMEFTVGPELFTGFPICMWGDGFRSHRLYMRHGFTHAIRYRSTRYLLRTEKRFYEADRRELDESLADGFVQGDTYDIGCARWGYALELKRKFPRISRYGSLLVGNINVLDPAAVNALENASLYLAGSLGSHPAYGIIVLNSEVRDNTMPSFSSYDRAAYRKFSGREIPELVNDKLAPHYAGISGFPVSRIVPDDDPLLNYYVWFWKHGDGWNAMQSRIAAIYRRKVKHPLLTVFDPAVRCPPIWGNGGKVDALNHWTYVNPDPIRAIATIDELRSMAAEKKQKVFGMGQLFVYREHVAPLAEAAKYPKEKFDVIRNERYITLPPDMLRELIWSMMCRRIDGVMFHGYGAVFAENKAPKEKYARAIRGADAALGKILREVVRPLGPLVSSLPDSRAKVAVFQGIAAAVFAGRGSYGNESWPYVVHRMLQYGGMDPVMLYEEEMMRDGFGDLRVIVLPHCDVLTASALKKLQEFQRKGGILVADEFLPPALMPDWRLSCRMVMDGIDDRALTAAERQSAVPAIAADEAARKARIQRAGRELAALLAPYCVPDCSSDDPDIVTVIRSGGSGSYLFAVNDRRRFGSYLGIYGKVMEEGAPNAGKIWANRRSSVVYDVLSGAEVPAEHADNRTVVPVRFSTCDGRLFLLLDEKIGKVTVSAPPKAAAGENLRYEVSVSGVSGSVIPAMIPLKLKVTYADGSAADHASSAVTDASGVFRGGFAVPLNAPAGEMTIQATSLPGGVSGEIRVKIDTKRGRK